MRRIHRRDGFFGRLPTGGAGGGASTSSARIRDVWRTFDPDLSPYPELEDLRDYWAARWRPGEPLPRYSDVDPLDLRDHLGWIFVAERVGGGEDFRYRLVGTKIADAYNAEYSGLTAWDVLGRRQPGYARDLLQAYNACLDEGRPFLSGGRVLWSERDYKTFLALNLPCSSDGVARDTILGRMVHGASA